MKTASVFLTALLLAACGKSASTDTVENLVANPDRLSELREQCKTNRAKLVMCSATLLRRLRAGDLWATAVCRIRRRRSSRSSDYVEVRYPLR